MNYEIYVLSRICLGKDSNCVFFGEEILRFFLIVYFTNPTFEIKDKPSISQSFISISSKLRSTRHQPPAKGRDETVAEISAREIFVPARIAASHGRWFRLG